MASGPQAYLLILGHREGLAWVLRTSRMAFTQGRAAEGAQLAVDDCLFLYTSRGCFGNPTRDRGRVIGEATVVSRVRARSQPLEIAGRDFTHDCEISLDSLAPFRKGVELAQLVGELNAFPHKPSWSARLRRPLVPIPKTDAKLLTRALAQVAERPEDALPSYAAVLDR